MVGELRPVRAALNTNGARFPTQAKKRLIATHAKLEISPTQTKHSTSHFLIATKNRVSGIVPCAASHGNPYARIEFRS